MVTNNFLNKTCICDTNAHYFCDIKYNTPDMNTTVPRRQTSFRLSEGLIEILRKEASKRNRSLNNFVESLIAFVSDRPNKTTLAAMREAENGDNLETLDIDDFRGFVDSL